MNIVEIDIESRTNKFAINYGFYFIASGIYLYHINTKQQEVLPAIFFTTHIELSGDK